VALDTVATAFESVIPLITRNVLLGLLLSLAEEEEAEMVVPPPLQLLLALLIPTADCNDDIETCLPGEAKRMKI